jgi:hypothetical protein
MVEQVPVTYVITESVYIHFIYNNHTRKNLTSCSKSANKLSSHCLSQVVNKFGTSCEQFLTTMHVDIIRLVTYQVVPTSPTQSWYNNIATTLCHQPCNILVISWLYQTCQNNLVTSLIMHQACYKLRTACSKRVTTTGNKQCEHNLSPACEQICNNLCDFTCVHAL